MVLTDYAYFSGDERSSSFSCWSSVGAVNDIRELCYFCNLFLTFLFCSLLLLNRSQQQWKFDGEMGALLVVVVIRTRERLNV